MKYFNLLFVTFVLWSTNASAYVICENIPVNVETAENPGFHSFNELGVAGSTLFISVPKANCTNSTGDTLSDTIFVVIDDIDNSAGLKKLWSSMLLSAQASNKTIFFHAADMGINSKGYQILDPYYLKIIQ